MFWEAQGCLRSRGLEMGRWRLWKRETLFVLLVLLDVEGVHLFIVETFFKGTCDNILNGVGVCSLFIVCENIWVLLILCHCLLCNGPEVVVGIGKRDVGKSIENTLCKFETFFR